jgi:hypothetical protein
MAMLGGASLGEDFPARLTYPCYDSRVSLLKYAVQIHRHNPDKAATPFPIALRSHFDEAGLLILENANLVFAPGVVNDVDVKKSVAVNIRDAQIMTLCPSCYRLIDTIFAHIGYSLY